MHLGDAKARDLSQTADSRPRGDVQPSRSPDGAHIAFASQREGDWEIYTMRPDGCDARQVTNSTVDDRHPTWSPGGSSIAYRSKVGRSWYIVTARADGSGEPRQLSTSRSNDSPPSWNPGTRKQATGLDFNGDGFADLAVRVPGEALGNRPGAGMVNFLYGSGEGLSAGGSQAWHKDSRGIEGVGEAGDAFADFVVHDLQTGTTERVSVRSGGAQSNSIWAILPGRPAISADGRYVVFLSGQSDLVAHDTNNVPDMFMHDRVTDETTHINITDDGEQMTGSYFARSVAITGNGALVAFVFYLSVFFGSSTDLNGFLVELPAPLLVPPPGESLLPVLAIACSPQPSAVGDAIARIDVACDDGSVPVGTPRSTASIDASSEGRFVAWVSDHATLVPADANRDTADAFLRDRQTGTTEDISVASDGSQPVAATLAPATPLRDLASDTRYANISY